MVDLMADTMAVGMVFWRADAMVWQMAVLKAVVRVC